MTEEETAMDALQQRAIHAIQDIERSHHPRQWSQVIRDLLRERAGLDGPSLTCEEGEPQRPRCCAAPSR